MGSSKEQSVKVKTSVNIEKGIWTEWIKFVVNRTGSARKVSEELAIALEEYMERHRPSQR